MQFGVKAANYPLIPEDFERNKLPGELHTYRSKLFGLTILPGAWRRSARSAGPTHAMHLSKTAATRSRPPSV